MFFGQFEHSIDEKGRMTIPVRYRELLVHGAYILRGLDNNLMVLKAENFETLQQHLSQMSITNSDARDLARRLFGSAAILEIDRSGRILIPQFLRDALKLNHSAVVVGNGIYFEIWDSESWQSHQELIENSATPARQFEGINLTF
jgi:MraZ protein